MIVGLCEFIKVCGKKLTKYHKVKNIRPVYWVTVHKTVNHSKNFVNPETGTHTNTIEGTWHGIKIHVPGRARHKEKVDNHISEFIWRRQNQDKLWDAFIICLGNTMLEEL